ncbi:STE/STE20 protein kinase [Nannizzia gypsea CBS 118893]|uniref:non-specific serine/threonine protein kinase n=1 Tax=Arthroderma gypseum (strain ATCC MYA-4604 / CBS 118893) TaxID=535722 RepID=E4UPT3_ARTGP|nr:STE/STE20 protein kinase [Nannizzia gypsea CBS 118893]EFQ99905.1 STE/STE20 protein kinase [Nannizzia gypsea CBS 118893]
MDSSAEENAQTRDAAWCDLPSPLRARGFTGSREDIQAASAYLFCNAAARLQQQNLDRVESTDTNPAASGSVLAPASRTHHPVPPLRERDLNEGNPEVASYLQSESYEAFSTQNNPVDNTQCISSFETYQSNKSRSTLAFSEEVDPDIGPNPPSISAQFPTETVVSENTPTSHHHPFNQLVDPKPTRESYRVFPRLREPQQQAAPFPAHKFDPHSRPFPIRRVCTTENHHYYEAPPVQTSKYKQYPRPQRVYTRGEFQARTRELLKHDTAPGGFNDFDPDFSNRETPATSTLKQVRSFPDPRSLTDPLPKSSRGLGPNNRQRSATAPKRPQPRPQKPREFKADSFPQPHHFSTLNPKSPYNPLNFIPGGVNSSGYLYLPAPGSQPVTRPEPDQAPPADSLAEPRAFHAQGDFGFPFDRPCTVEPAPETCPAPLRPVFRLEFPSAQEIKDRKRKKNGARRFTSSLKKLFSRKTKSDPENTTAASCQPNADSSPAPKAEETFKGPPSAAPLGRFREELSEADPTQAAQLEEQLKDVDPAQAEHFAEQLRKPFITVTVDPPPEDDSTPPQDTPSMFTAGHLDPSSAVMAITKQKAEAMRLAREQGFIVREMCRRAKTEIPPYTFEELIGKGSYGRVYRGHHLSSNSVVAIKVMDIDNLDYETTRDFKDESIKDFIHETKVMSQVKEAGAKNINIFIEAVSIHSQLWLVSEYCPGGSIKTLMRATGDKLEEKFIIPIAREVAVGLKAIHDAGIIHRDVKAGNILIHEEGNIQICDFGVAGVLQSQRDKRSTWIGTPHWMPPELFPSKPGDEVHPYGNEIDVWAYGCTLFECATGNPPNATLRERMQIGRQLNRFTPRLDGENYSEELCGIVSYALDADPRTRPAMGDILGHPYIAGSEQTHPTESLRELVKTYYQWSQRGGQRISLFNPGGAVAAEMPGVKGPLEDEAWNFSTTEGFEKRFSIIDLDQISASLAALETEQSLEPNYSSFDQFNMDSEERELTAEEKVNFDERVKRGAAAMEGLFDEAKPKYKYETKNDFVPVEQTRKITDLPLRTDTDRSSVASTFIDINLGVYDSSHYASASGSANPPFQLADADTIRANRSSSRSYRASSSAGSEPQDEFPQNRGPRPPTMDWKFPTTATSIEEHESPNATDDEIAPHDAEPLEQPREEKRDTRAWTFPVMTVEEDGPGDEPIDETAHAETPGAWSSDNESTTAQAMFPLQHSPSVLDRAIGKPEHRTLASESRPSTAESIQSSVSDADYDPFRLDREGVSSGPANNVQRRGLAKAPPIREPDYPYFPHDDEYNNNHSRPNTANGFEEHHVGSLPESVTLRNGNATAVPLSRSGSSSMYSQNGNSNGNLRGSLNPAPAAENNSLTQFPELNPPSIESLTEGASDEVVTAELDRLFGELMHGLAATGEAIQSMDSAKAAESDVRPESP